ncbi:MAG: translation initiation factor IF-3 [Thermoguttaceae bacterium]|nr:translation initiation factor IF-3 [Thermoguttaceae bacterium]
MIRAPQVRVIAEDGQQLGVMSSSEALAAARNAGMDLVEVAPDSKPPVCRILDYGKFKYEQKKKAVKPNASKNRIKELRLRPKTGEHDMLVKVNKAREFLTKKEKVLLTISFKGREVMYSAEGMKLMESIVAQLEDVAKVESPAKQMGKKINCTLAPK